MTDATGGPDPEWGKEVDDEGPQIIRFATEFGFMEVFAPRWLPAGFPRPTPEEMREAATRYLRARYAQPWVDPDVIRGIERVTGEEYRDGTWHKTEDPPRWMLGPAAQDYPGEDDEP